MINLNKRVFALKGRVHMQNLRNFLIAFGVGLVVFGIAAVMKIRTAIESGLI